MTLAAIASLWSRAFSTTSDAAGLVRRGGYQSAIPLVRQAVELVGAQRGLGSDLDEFKRWVHSAYATHAETRADDIGLGHYFSGESIADDEHLRLIYRAASDFGRPNFGPTALFTAAAATHERYPLLFADEAFHFGWGQMLFGWLLRTGLNQLHLAMHARDHFPAADELREAVVAHVRAAEALLDDPARCRVEPYEDADLRQRHLILQFRRQSADAPRRLLI
jgi:hypothetical protein